MIVNLRLFKSLACVGTILFLYGCSATEKTSYTISDLYIFGDSLSDTGNAKTATSGVFPDRNYYEGRFSDGPNYADQLAQDLNTPLKPSRSFGSNYAYGGTRSLEINAQVFNYKENAEGIAKEGAYYIVWAGANDLMQIIALQPEDPNDEITKSVGHIENAIRTLAGMGATKILVPNQPNMAKLPRFKKLAENASELQSLTESFNTTLDEMLDKLLTDDNIITIKSDIFDLFNTVLTNPNDYGLSDIETPCYSKSEIFIELTGEEEICSDSASYFFWDEVHPGTTVHTIIANEFHTALTAE